MFINWKINHSTEYILHFYILFKKKKLLTKAFIKTLKQNIQIKQHCV